MKRIERKQAAMSRMNVQSQPAFSATEPITILARMAVPRK